MSRIPLDLIPIRDMIRSSDTEPHEPRTKAMPKQYDDEAREDAADTVRNFIDTIVDAIVDDGEASDDLLNDYGSGDSYHHENHTDRDYDLTESAEVLDQLDQFEETDSGLWEGIEPRRAIAVQAAYTYGNAVYSYFQEIIGDINASDDIEELREEYERADSQEMDLEVDDPPRPCDEIKKAIHAAVLAVANDFDPSYVSEDPA
jgi:hypothetical protein